jgi:D-alanyl-D-alanine carboxypeptidase/D-alanyl-D-alanine-endopeptidase (penicillin-binding protein 4)
MARSNLAPVWEESLPVAAGGVGSLRNRMGGTAAAGNLRAKTGTIREVSSLSGYVRTADGERLAFSIVANDLPDEGRAKRLEDQIGARLARFRR